MNLMILALSQAAAPAAKRCGAMPVVAGEQRYDQSTGSDGLPAPIITHLRMTNKCG